MKVTIRGNNPITSEQFKQVIDSLNEEMAHLGIKVKMRTGILLSRCFMAMR